MARWLDELAAHFRNQPAVITGEAARSFADLAREARRLALALAELGVNKGTHVGVLLPNSPDWLVAAWATWRLGAVLVPLNTLWTAAELERALRLADVQFLLSATRFLRHDYVAVLTALGLEAGASARPHPRLPALRRVVWWGENPPAGALSWADLVPKGAASDEWLQAMEQQVHPSEPAAIFFTSGSEAEPKAVVHTHASVLAAARGIGERLGLTAQDRTWAYLPFFFAGGLIAFALASWGRGAALLLQEVFDPERAVRLMEQYGCTVFFAWPHQAEAIARHPRFEPARFGIRKGPGAQAAWAPRIFAEPHHAVSSWGMTEAGPLACCSAWDDPVPRRTETHGRPLPGVELCIVDPDTGEPLPSGETGEILIRGATVMESYYRRRPHECFDERGFFRTGDLGWVDGEGYLHFIGRRREVIKTAGVNVAPAEVEAVLSTHPQVALAVVVPVTDPERGENVAAFVVPAANTEPPGEQALAEFCRSHLAAYKVPRHFFFVAREELPSTGSGKYDKRALRHKAEALLGHPRNTGHPR